MDEAVERRACGGTDHILRANGIPYQGIKLLVLWFDAVMKSYSAPIWKDVMLR
jgi:antirestriction protein ArdC